MTSNDKIKVFQNKAKGTTTVKLVDTHADAFLRIVKRLEIKNVDNADNYRLDRAFMPSNITATVKLDSRDEWDDKFGVDKAINKAMKNHNKSFRKALKRWQVAMLKDIIAVSPETFEDALHEVRPCQCKCDK